jgi:hypothetical protein
MVLLTPPLEYVLAPGRMPWYAKRGCRKSGRICLEVAIYLVFCKPLWQLKLQQAKEPKIPNLLSGRPLIRR